MPSIVVQRYGRQEGFTLLEMIVVVAVLGLTLVLIAGYRPPWSGGLGVRGAAGELASALRLARSEAIARDGPISVAIDVASRRYRVGDGQAHALPPGFKVEFLTLASDQSSRNVGEMRFYPDGSSTGGRVAIGDGAHTLLVGVDWLNGRVSIGDGP